VRTRWHLVLQFRSRVVLSYHTWPRTAKRHHQRPGRTGHVHLRTCHKVLDSALLRALLAKETILELQEMRDLLEDQIVTLATQRATDEDLQAMQHWLSPPKQTIIPNWSSLLLEGMRRIDESVAGVKGLDTVEETEEPKESVKMTATNRRFASGFLQTPPRGDALAFSYGWCNQPPSGSFTP